MYIKDNKKEIVTTVFLATWIIYYLAVLMKTGFISDDAYASQLKGMLIQKGISLQEAFLSQISGWIFGSGRFLITGELIACITYYFTQSTVIVKAVNIAVIVVGIILFYYFSKRETGSSNIALLACMLVPIFFQFRLWHDPILAFTFLIPTIFAMIMGALVLFQQYLDNQKFKWYIGATFLFIISLLAYEISYPLCLLFIVIAYSRSRNIFSAIKQSLLFIIPTVILIALIGAIKINLAIHQIKPIYSGAEFHLDINKLISALEIQASASIPLSYYIFNKENLATELYAIDYLILAFFFSSIAILIHQIGKSAAGGRFASWMAIGGIMLLVSVTLASLSGHQDELNQAGYGYGYITVYFQYFGACILTVALLAYVARKVNGRWLAVLAILVSAVFTVVAAKNLKLNRAVALKTNEFYVYPRHLLQSALDAGIADEMKDDAFLFRTMRYPSDWMWFYSTITNKKLITCELSDNIGFKKCIENMQSSAIPPRPVFQKLRDSFEVLDLSEQQAWALSYNFEKKAGETGRVIFGKVDRVVQNSESKTAIQIIVSQIKLYDLKENKVQSLNVANKPVDFLKIVTDETADMGEARPYDFERLRISEVGFEWLGKIHAREGTNESNLRWSSGSATLTLHNLSDNPKWVHLQMGLATPTTPASKLSINYAGKTEMLILAQTPTIYSKKLLIAPGSMDIMFTSDAQPIQNGDPRNIVFGIFNFIIF
jgi:hypothetical protein